MSTPNLVLANPYRGLGSRIGTSANVTIFEGPDGCGKTTAARDYAERTCARYVHCTVFPKMTHVGLARLYFEAMLPAILGLQSVVLDRSWISEEPYGMHVRGRVRFPPAHRRMLDRVAARCAGAVVLCLPPYAVARHNYDERVEGEYPGNLQFDGVYAYYRDHWNRNTWYTRITALPSVKYDYTHIPDLPIGHLIPRDLPHPLDRASAGFYQSAKFVLVGERFTQHTDYDALLQLPFVSFDPNGSSRWLTDQLDAGSIYERELLWINADQLADRPTFYPPCLLENSAKIIALGHTACDVLNAVGLKPYAVFDHPQHHKRFKFNEPYPLIDALQRLRAL